MVTLVQHDLQFILNQIILSEQHAAGTPLTDLIVNPLLPYGVRTVDGSYNNIVPGRETWGSADQEFIRLTDVSYRPGYGPTGTVIDPAPRTISNLIVDMTLNNPAAIAAALKYAGSTNITADMNAIIAAHDALEAAIAAAQPLTPAELAALQLQSESSAALAASLAAAVVLAQADAAAAQVDYEAALNAYNAAVTATTAAEAGVIAAFTGGGNLTAAVQEWLDARTAETAAQTTLNTEAGELQSSNDLLAAATTAATDAATQAATDLAAYDAALATGAGNSPDVLAAQAALDAVLEEAGVVMSNDSLVIPNVAPDEGLSAPFNSWMTLFGQFFDHGLDLVAKQGASVVIPLMPDDPLYVPGGHTNFMVVTRSLPDAHNVTTPFVDQNQTYTSHASHQVFLREYELDASGRPVATGRLLENRAPNDAGEYFGPGSVDLGGLATWAVVKAQARELLGIELTDADVTNVPLMLTDQYGKFIPDPITGFAQVIIGAGPPVVVVSGTPDAPVSTAQALRTDHAFLDDIAHTAAPVIINGALVADTDADTGNAILINPQTGARLEYDNELLDRHFITGDGRGNENIGLTAVHHVFHSEHNRLVEHIKDVVLATNDLDFINQWLDVAVTAVPTESGAIAALDWNGERVFQAARFGTEMQYQHLVFEEFARKIQPDVDAFVFNATTDVNPAIFAEFAHTVYRFGHSMLNETVDMIDSNGNLTEVGLIQAFLNPVGFHQNVQADGSVPAGSGVADSGAAAGAIIRGMTRQVGNEIDEFVTEALRNNLLGLPLDLAAINLARGRETGIPTLNEARAQFYEIANFDTQLKPYTSWVDFAINLKHSESIINFIAAYGTHSSITSASAFEDKRAAATLLVMGGEGAPADATDFLNGTGTWAGVETGLNLVDFWIGGLAEKTMAFGGMLGSTFSFVFELQLENLQTGDRFYYLTRTQGLNFLNELENNSFTKLAMLNTDLGQPGQGHLPGDIFSVPNYILEMDQSLQRTGILGPDGVTLNGDPVGNDPILEALQPMVDRRDLDGDGDMDYLHYRGGDHVVLGGTEEDDVLIAGDGDDTIWGDGGNDTIEAGYGVDLAHGGAGDDIITNSGTDIGETDFLHGDEGFDVIQGGSGLALIFGGADKDVIFAGPDGKEVFGGTGDDFILGGDGGDFLLGNEGDDWIEGGNGFDVIAGDNSELFFNSTIIGHDVMFAGENEQDFDAEAGDDIMVQGESVIRNEGMAGFDWAIFKGAQINAYADMRIPIFTTAEEDILRNRFDRTEALSGWIHDDTLIGDDRVQGTPDPLEGHLPESTFVTDELTQEGVDRIAGLQQLIGPLTPDENGFVFNRGNILIGGGGSDTIQGRGGDDIIDGDAWLNVRISIRDANGVELDTVDSLAGDLTNASLGWAGRSLQSLLMSREIHPSQLHIVREILDGGQPGDIDTAVYSDNFENYSITTNPDGTITIQHVTVTAGLVDEGTDVLRNIEQLRFADVEFLLNTPPEISQLGADTAATALLINENTTVVATLTGTDAQSPPQQLVWSLGPSGQRDNSLFTISAAGVLAFAVAPDFENPLSADGDNLYEVEVLLTDGAGGQDSEVVFVSIQDVAGQTIVSNLPVINGTSEDDTIRGGNSANVINAGAGADTVLGLGGNDTLNGGDGDDSLDGGAGNDTINGDAGNDILLGEAGNDTLNGGDGADSLDGGAGNDTINGGAGNDILVGGLGNDMMNGGAGDDQMAGGSGNDTYVVDSAGDQVIELSGQGNDTVQTVLNSYQLGPNVEHLTFIGTGDFVGTGNEQSNSITGSSGNDVLDGGLGDDRLVGGAGDDTYIVDSAADAVVEAAGAGIDTMLTSVTRTIAANVENMTLTGSAAINGTGNALDNIITGNTAANALSGAGGNDTLIGGGGADTLAGGAGSDTLIIADGNFSKTANALNGGDGQDTLVFGGAFSLNLSSIANNVVANIEAIDMTNSASNTLTIGVDDVRAMSGLNNSALAAVFPAASLAAGNNIIIDGEAGDVTNLVQGPSGADSNGQWFLMQDVVIGGETYSVYNYLSNTAGLRATVAVNADMTINV